MRKAQKFLIPAIVLIAVAGLFYATITFAASVWEQNNWTGGADPDATATHSLNQDSWPLYFEKTADVQTDGLGSSFKLKEKHGELFFTTYNDFYRDGRGGNGEVNYFKNNILGVSNPNSATDGKIRDRSISVFSKPYSFTPAASVSYPDTGGIELTNGVWDEGQAWATQYQKFAVLWSSSPTITFTLPESTLLNQVRVYVQAGVNGLNHRYTPLFITVQTSSDGVHYTEVGRDDTPPTTVAHWVDIPVDTVSCKYVRIYAEMYGAAVAMSEIELNGPSGNVFDSGVIDIGHNVSSWGDFEWTSSGGIVLAEIQTSKDNETWGPWTSILTGRDINYNGGSPIPPGGFSGDRYIHYRLELTDANAEVDDVKIGYNYAPTDLLTVDNDTTFLASFDHHFNAIYSEASQEAGVASVYGEPQFDILEPVKFDAGIFIEDGTANMVENANFERGHDLVKGHDFDSWVETQGENSTVESDTDDFLSAQQSLQMNVVGGEYVDVQQEVAVEPDTDYVLSFYAKGTGSVSVALQALEETTYWFRGEYATDWVQDSGTTVTVLDQDLTDQWIKYEVPFTTVSTTSDLRLYLIRTTDSGDYSINIDDVQLAEPDENRFWTLGKEVKPLTGGEDGLVALFHMDETIGPIRTTEDASGQGNDAVSIREVPVVNAGMEEGTADWSCVSGDNMISQANDKVSGEYSLQCTDWNSNSQCWKIISVDTGFYYYLSLWAKNPYADSVSYVRIGTSLSGSQYGSDLTPLQSWGQFNYEFETTTNNLYITLYSGQRVNESRGNRIDDIVLKRAPNFTMNQPGKFSQSYSFNGTTEFMNINNPTGLSDSEVSVEAWVYIDEDTDHDGWIIHNDYSVAAGKWLLFYDNDEGKVKFAIVRPSDLAQSAASISISKGEWHHVVGTYNDRRIKIYVDGIMSKSGWASGYDLDISSDIVISSTDSSTAFKGKLDEVAVWNRALTGSEVAGQIGVDSLSYPSSGNLVTNSAGSIEMWVKPMQNVSDVTAQYRYLFDLRSEDDDAGNKIGLYIDDDSDDLIFRVSNGRATNYRTITYSIDDSNFGNDKFHYIVGTWDGPGTDTTKLYLDGLDVETNGASAVGVGSPYFSSLVNENFYIGSDFNGQYQPNAIFDELRISDVARTAEEVAHNYEPVEYLVSSPYNTEHLFGGPSALSWVDNSGMWNDPAGAEIYLQLRTVADDAGAPGDDWSEWQGPEGAGSFYDLSGEALNNILLTDNSDDQWMQYKVTLHSFNGGDNPEISAVDVTYVRPDFYITHDTAPAIQTDAGSKFLVKLAFQDSDGTVVKTYTGQKTIHFSGPIVSKNGDVPKMSLSQSMSNPMYFDQDLTLNFTEGEVEVWMQLFNADQGTPFDITATDVNSGISTGDHPFKVTLNHGTIISYQVDEPQTAFAGDNFSVTVTPQDEYGNSKGSDVVVLSAVLDAAGTPGNGTLTSATYPGLMVDTSGGPVTVTDLHYTLAENIKIMASDGDVSSIFGDIVNTIDVFPNVADHFEITGDDVMNPGDENVITISAHDSFGNLVDRGAHIYQGLKGLTFTGANLAPNGQEPTCSGQTGDVAFDQPADPSTVAINFDAGQATSTMKLYLVEDTQINASTAALDSEGHGLDVSVQLAGVVDHYGISANHTSVFASEGWHETVSAYDAYDNLEATINDSVILSGSADLGNTFFYPDAAYDAATPSPRNYMLTDGQAEIFMRHNTGAQTVTITAEDADGKTGSQDYSIENVLNFDPPTSSTVWGAGEQRQVQWIVADGADAYTHATKRIRYFDGGNEYTLASTGVVSPFTWNIDQNANIGSNYRVKIEDAGPDGNFTTSDDNNTSVSEEFSVSGGLQFMAPAGGEKWSISTPHTIEWGRFGTFGVNVAFRTSGAGEWIPVSNGMNVTEESLVWTPANDWTGPNGSDAVQIQISDGTSSNPANPVASNPITICSLNIGTLSDEVNVGGQMLIPWTSVGVSQVKLEYYSNKAEPPQYVKIDGAESLDATDNSFLWNGVPDDVGSNVTIRATAVGAQDADIEGPVVDISDPFTIVGVITLMLPQDGATYSVTAPLDIKFSASSTIDSFNFFFSKDLGNEITDITSQVTYAYNAGEGVYEGTWMPTDAAKEAWIRVEDSVNSSAFDQNQDPFIISGVILDTFAQNDFTVGSDVTISGTAQGASRVKLYYSTSSIDGPYTLINGGTEVLIGAHASCPQVSVSENTFSTLWTIPDDISDTVFIKVENYDNGNVSDAKGPFNIKSGLVVDTPTDSQWTVGEAGKTISGSVFGTVDQVTLEYSIDGGANWTVLDDTDTTPVPVIADVFTHALPEVPDAVSSNVQFHALDATAGRAAELRGVSDPTPANSLEIQGVFEFVAPTSAPDDSLYVGEEAMIRYRALGSKLGNVQVSYAYRKGATASANLNDYSSFVEAANLQTPDYFGAPGVTAEMTPVSYQWLQVADVIENLLDPIGTLDEQDPSVYAQPGNECWVIIRIDSDHAQPVYSEPIRVKYYEVLFNIESLIGTPLSNLWVGESLQDMKPAWSVPDYGLASGNIASPLEYRQPVTADEIRRFYPYTSTQYTTGFRVMISVTDFQEKTAHWPVASGVFEDGMIVPVRIDTTPNQKYKVETETNFDFLKNMFSVAAWLEQDSQRISETSGLTNATVVIKDSSGNVLKTLTADKDTNPEMIDEETGAFMLQWDNTNEDASVKLRTGQIYQLVTTITYFGTEYSSAETFTLHAESAYEVDVKASYDSTGSGGIIVSTTFKENGSLMTPKSDVELTDCRVLTPIGSDQSGNLSGSTVEDATNAIFTNTWYPSGGLTAGQTYTIISKINYLGNDYVGSTIFTVEPIAEISDKVDAMSLQVAAVDQAITGAGGVAETVDNVQTSVDNLTTDVQTNEATQDAFRTATTGTLTNIDTTTGAILEDTDETIPQLIADQTTAMMGEFGKAIQGQIVSRPTSATPGSTTKIRYRAQSGLTGTDRPTITVYDPSNGTPVFEQPMSEIGSTGIYDYSLWLNPSWGTGEFTVVCKQAAMNSADSLLLSVEENNLDAIAQAISNLDTQVLNLQNSATIIQGSTTDIQNKLNGLLTDLGPVDVFRTTIDNIDSNVNGLATVPQTLADIQTAIAALNVPAEELTGINDRLDTITSTINAINSTTTTIAQDTAGLGDLSSDIQNLADLINNMDIPEQVLIDLNDTLTGMTAQINNIDSRTSAILTDTEALGNISQSVADLQALLQTFDIPADVMTNISDTLTAMDTTINEVNNRTITIDTNTVGLSSFSTDIANLTQLINGLDIPADVLTGINSTLGGISSMVTAIDQKTDNLQTSIDALASLSTDIANLQTLIQGLDIPADVLTGINGTLQTINSMVGQVYGDTQQIRTETAGLSDFFDDIITLQNMIAGLDIPQEVLTQINGNLQNIINEVGEVKGIAQQISTQTALLGDISDDIIQLNALLQSFDIPDEVLTNINNRLESMSQTIIAVDGKTTTLITNTDGLSSLSGDISYLTGLIENLDIPSDLQTVVDASLQGISGSLEALTQNVNTMGTVVDRIDTNTTNLGEISSDINNLYTLLQNLDIPDEVISEMNTTLQGMVSKVDAINDTTVTIAGNTAGLAGLSDDIISLQQMIADLDIPENVLNNINGALQGISSTVAETNQNTAKIMQDTAGLADFYDNIINLQQMIAGLDIPEEALTSINGQLQGIASILADMSDTTNTMAGDVSNLAGLTDDVATLQTLIQGLDLPEEALTQINSSLGGIGSMVADMNDRTIAIKEDTGGLAALSGDIETLQNTINGLDLPEEAISEINNRLATISNGVNNATDQIADVGTAVNRIDANTQNLGQLSDDIGDLRNMLQTMDIPETQMDGIMDSLSTIESAVSGLSGEIASMNAGDTEGLIQRIDSMGDDLTAAKKEIMDYIDKVQATIGSSGDGDSSDTIFGKIANIETSVSLVGVDALNASTYARNARDNAAGVIAQVKEIKDLLAQNNYDSIKNAIDQLPELSKSLNSLEESLANVSGGIGTDEVMGEVKTILANLKSVAGEKGLSGLNFNIGNGGSDMEDVKTTMSELKVLMNNVQNMMDKEVNKPVIKGWLDK